MIFIKNHFLKSLKMTDNLWELFDDAVKEVNNSIILPKKRAIIIFKNNHCPHSHVEIVDNISHCINCGLELNREEKYDDKEWKSSSDNRFKNTNTTRCQVRRNDNVKSIYKDIEYMGISKHIQDSANRIFRYIDDQKIFHGKKRKPVIFACIFYAYKYAGYPQSFEYLQEIFKLSRKDISRGMKLVGLNIKKYGISNNSIEYITPIHLLPNILRKFGADKLHLNNVIQIYSSLSQKQKNHLLNKSRPQSVATSLFYYYCSTSGKKITLADVSAKTGLSSLTIQKLTLEIKSMLPSTDEL